MIGQWLKAKRSKYKHFYVSNEAICGSAVVAYSPTESRKRAGYQYCPTCKAKKAQLEKDELKDTQALARRLTVALMAVYYDAQPKDDLGVIVCDLFDEAQAKLEIDELVPDARLYEKYLGLWSDDLFQEPKNKELN